MVIDERKGVLKVIDWGLAEFYHPKSAYNVKVASRFYKGPELMVNYQYYDYSLDMWSFGCVLAEMIFKIFPFFCGEDNADQMHKIIEVLGTEGFMEYLSQYEITPPKEVMKRIPKTPSKKFESFINDGLTAAPQYLTVIDLLRNLLVYDHAKRLTAKECISHSFFRER
jgi:casein kinase II subunit alpha